MANTTSGTATFGKGFSISDIVEESFERIGMSGVSGYQLKSARTSLNIMFQEWANRGLHYWEIANNNLTLVNGQNVYTMFRSASDGTSDATAIYGVEDVLEASYRNAQNVDFPLTKVGRAEYQSFASKTSKGTPTQYFVQRFIDKIIPCMVAGLAYYLAQKYQPERVGPLKAMYEEELLRALQQDGSPASTFITPRTYYPNI